MAFAISNCNLKPKSTTIVSCRSFSISSILHPQALSLGRRSLIGIFLSTAAVFPVLAAANADDSQSLLLRKYLKKSEENKTKNDKERLDSYYKRNYKDYFELFGESLKDKDKDKLTDTEKEIIDWLEKNK